jgi:hypothetical protein
MTQPRVSFGRAILLTVLLCAATLLAISRSFDAAAETIGPGMSDNTDRPGGDVANAPSSSPQACLQQCRADKRCKSWTYARPGAQGGGGVCYLKGSIPNAVANGCCISGFRGKTLPMLTGTVGPHVASPASETVVNYADKRCPKGAVRATSPGHLADLLGFQPGPGATPTLATDPEAENGPPGFVGCIVIPKDAAWRMALKPLQIGPGVSLIGERGELGSRPILYSDDASEKYCLFRTNGDNVRIEGIEFRGPFRDEGQTPNTSAICVTRDPANKAGVTLIADNEFGYWTGQGVSVTTPNKAASDAEYRQKYPTASYFHRRDAKLVRIERNYFHHNLQKAVGGYGVSVGGGAFAQITGNVFDTNRHSVASDGQAHSGYIARFNFILDGGVKEGWSYNQHFDVHGTGEDGYNGQGGDYYEISNNAVRGVQSYGAGFKTRPVFMLRAKPTKGAYFNANVLLHCNLTPAISLKTDNGAGDLEIYDFASDFNFHEKDNKYGTDHSSEIAAGDFDGDRRSDVFVATGTAWFMSRGGVRFWEFLRPSDKLTRDLAFADMDNDGVTDVLYRDGGGGLLFVKSGTHPPSSFARLPVAIKDLHFGDFDADRLTDMFYAQGGRWFVWYGRARDWQVVQSSDISPGQYLFGDFDDAPGTDVVAPANGGWSVASGATHSWAPLNAMLKSSLADAVAADFDGNGETDIAFGDEGRWTFSRDGRGPLVALRNGGDEPRYLELKDLVVGNFDGGGRAKVIGFELYAGVPPCKTSSSGGPSSAWIARARLMMWDGFGSGAAFATRSAQNMR